MDRHSLILGRAQPVSERRLFTHKTSQKAITSLILRFNERIFSFGVFNIMQFARLSHSSLKEKPFIKVICLLSLFLDRHNVHETIMVLHLDLYYNPLHGNARVCLSLIWDDCLWIRHLLIAFIGRVLLQASIERGFPGWDDKACNRTLSINIIA